MGCSNFFSVNAKGGGQNLERRNVQQPIFRNLKIAIMSYSIIFFSNLFFHLLEIILTPRYVILFQIVNIDFLNNIFFYFPNC